MTFSGGLKNKIEISHCTVGYWDKNVDIWLHQLCKKFAKETIFNIWRNIF